MLNQHIPELSLHWWATCCTALWPLGGNIIGYNFWQKYHFSIQLKCLWMSETLYTHQLNGRKLMFKIKLTLIGAQFSCIYYVITLPLHTSPTFRAKLVSSNWLTFSKKKEGLMWFMLLFWHLSSAILYSTYNRHSTTIITGLKVRSDSDVSQTGWALWATPYQSVK